MTGNPAFHNDTTLTLVFALMRPLFSVRVLRVSPPLVLLLNLHTVLTSSLKSLILLLNLHTVLTSSLKSLVLLLLILTRPCLISLALPCHSATAQIITRASLTCTCAHGWPGEEPTRGSYARAERVLAGQSVRVCERVCDYSRVRTLSLSGQTLVCVTLHMICTVPMTCTV